VRCFHARALLGPCLALALCQGCVDQTPSREPVLPRPERTGDSRPATDPAAPIPAVVYIPTPHDIVERMLKLAQIGPDDVVYDLGCGDGRVVIAAAKRHGCRAVGCDIDPRRVEEARENVRSNKVEHLVEIRQEDLFRIDLSPASVITLYLTPGYNARLIPQLAKTGEGTRIVSHMFEIRGAVAERVLRIQSSKDGREHVLYLYTTD
jgi:tRNA G37 N-methylase Trm5